MSGVGERAKSLSLSLGTTPTRLGIDYMAADITKKLIPSSNMKMSSRQDSQSPRDKENLRVAMEKDVENVVTFIVEGRPIAVERNALKGIEVFEAMFSSVMREGLEATVEVPNYLYGIIRKMLTFIESDYVEVEDTAEALELLRAADQYQVLALKAFCVDYIKQHTTMENIEDVVQLGCLLQIPELSNILDVKYQDSKRSSFFSIAVNTTVEIQNAAIRAVVKDYAFAVKRFCSFMERNWAHLEAGFKSVLLKTSICNKSGDEKMVRLLLNCGAKPEVEHLFLAINVGESMLSLLLKCSYAAINDFGDNQRLVKPLDWALDSLGNSNGGFVMVGGKDSPNRRRSLSRNDIDILKEIDDGPPEDEKERINGDNIVSVLLMYMTKQDPFSVTWKQMCKIIDRDLVRSTEIALNSREWRCSMFPGKSCEERRFGGVKGCKEFHHSVNRAYTRALDNDNEEMIIVLLLNGVVKAHHHYVFRLIDKGFYKALEIWCNRGLEISQRDNCYRGRGRCITYHRTPLEFALMKGRLDMAKLFIQTDRNIITNTTLHSLIKLQQKQRKESSPILTRSSSNLNDSPTKDKEALTRIQGNAINAPVLDIMHQLVELGADVNLTFWETKRTPLHLAVQKGDLGTVKFLIENGANVNAVNISGDTPIHLAVGLPSPQDEDDKLEIIKYLIEQGADFEVENSIGERVLHLAAIHRSVNMVSFLTTKGADVNIPLRGDKTPLHLAAKEGDFAVLQALMSTTQPLDLYKRDKENKICLHYAVQRGDTAMIDALLERQPISSFVDVELLDLAADQGNKRIVSLLVEVSIKTSQFREDIAVWALKRRYHHILRDLLRAGCDPNATVDATAGDTLLHLACRQGRVQVVKGLVKAKADVQRTNKYNWTPLFEAAKGGFVAVVEYLIQAGADVEHWDKQGRTAFIVAQSAKGEERAKEYDKVLNLLEEAVWG